MAEQTVFRESDLWLLWSRASRAMQPGLEFNPRSAGKDGEGRLSVSVRRLCDDRSAESAAASRGDALALRRNTEPARSYSRDAGPVLMPPADSNRKVIPTAWDTLSLDGHGFDGHAVQPLREPLVFRQHELATRVAGLLKAAG